VQGLTLGTLQSLSALARVLGPAAGGLLYQAIAPTAPYVAGAIGMIAAAWLSLRLAPLARASKPMAESGPTARPAPSAIPPSGSEA
jgi:predicted MFS family arabinose efflux permease